MGSFNGRGVRNAWADLNRLRQAMNGELIGPADAGYDEARRIWNGAIDRRPAAIARCVGVSDFVSTVRFARERDLPVAVRGGGHGVAGHSVCDDGLVIDLSPMKEIEVDPRARTARAGAGVLWGELDRESQAFGLATTGGIVTHTGIAGLTLGGGIGWLMRKHGATVDNLLSAELVTVDGDVVTASADENPDLFWGLRGGGGNFGIVTSFEYRLHPLGPQVLGGPIFYSLEDAPEVLRFYRDFIADTPDELTTVFNLRRAAALPLLPPEVHGRPVLIVTVCYAGPIDEGEAVCVRFGRSARPSSTPSAPCRTQRSRASSTLACRTAGTTTGSRWSCRRSRTARSRRSSNTRPCRPHRSPTASSSSSAVR